VFVDPEIEYGDQMDEYRWDGPENSDEEVEEFVAYKSDYEKDLGVRFSRRGIISFVESLVSQETPRNVDDPKTSKKWEEKLKTPGITMLLKRGGSHLSADQPYIRTESNFNKNFKMQKLLKIVSDCANLVRFTSLTTN
jgi:hypothetical protein